jgi:glycosyltransferase involved in cell wall biosynthesis
LEDKAKKEGVIDQLILPGFVTDEELAVLFRNAIAYVMPSLSEGFGLPALEAMASRVPVVCSDIPVLKEVCGDNALYIDPKSSDDIAGAIRKLQSDQGLRDKMIAEGLERVRQFSWRKTAAQTLQVYEDALS